jgi:hypothetical protein
MYTEKRKGASNEPCGTPDVIGKGVDNNNNNISNFI